jgi:hypothetical protein
VRDSEQAKAQATESVLGSGPAQVSERVQVQVQVLVQELEPALELELG